MNLPSSRPAEELHRFWAEIDHDALRHNAAVVRRHIGPAPRVMAVVKADAYGHGMVEVAATLQSDAAMFGVANIAEARLLRSALPDAAIFLLGPALSHEREEIVRSSCIAPVSSFEEALAYSRVTSQGRIQLHLAVDTGMGRIGAWQEDALETALQISRLPGVELAGIGSHLPVADEDETFTKEQLARFENLVQSLHSAGIVAPLVHTLNSAGIILFPQKAASLVRAGLMLYGASPVPEFQLHLRPVLSLKTRVTLVRPMEAGRGVSYGRTFITTGRALVGTLAVGYADGYQRHLSNKGADVLIRGRRCPVLGRVTMDQIMVDLTSLPDVTAGEEAVLLGQQGAEEITVAELAGKAGTIPWEIFTGIGRRAERIHLRNAAKPR